MASEILAVPEEHLAEVIAVVRAGLKQVTVQTEVLQQLTKWCNEEEEYLSRSEGDDE